MAGRKRGLGRNLNALLSNIPSVDIVEAPTHTISPLDNDLQYLLIADVEPNPDQPRQVFDPEALDELAQSIKQQGVLQPIVVRRKTSGKYELIAGERRWRAAQLAELTKIPAMVRDLDDMAVMAIALIENMQREDLNPMEEARAIHRLATEFDLTHRQVADAVGKSRTTVTNLLRLMNLQDKVRQMLEHGDIEMGHARAVLGLEPEAQVQAAEAVIAQNLSVRETEAYVARMHKPNPLKTRTTNTPDQVLIELQQQFMDKLDLSVSIKGNRRGKGKLIINYRRIEDIESILEKL